MYLATWHWHVRIYWSVLQLHSMWTNLAGLNLSVLQNMTISENKFCIKWFFDESLSNVLLNLDLLRHVWIFLGSLGSCVTTVHIVNRRLWVYQRTSWRSYVYFFDVSYDLVEHYCFWRRICKWTDEKGLRISGNERVRCLPLLTVSA